MSEQAQSCDDRTCGRPECARCADAANVFRMLADKAAGKPAPAVPEVTYEDSPFTRLLKRDWQP